MQTVATPAETIVARDTAILEPLFRTLYADPALCPKRITKAAKAMWTAERTASGQWLVPSSNGHDAYTVDPTGKVCSCPDHQSRGVWCYHGLSVWLYQRWERAEAEAGVPADDETRAAHPSRECREHDHGECNEPSYCGCPCHQPDPDAPIDYGLTPQALAALNAA